MEIWKDIPGYVGRYQASTLGRVRSLDRYVFGKNKHTEFKRKVKGTILKPGKYSKSGHVSVILGRGTNGQPIHQLIMKTFVGEAPSGMEVLHINGDPLDNRLENLRYGTRRENILDVYKQGKKWKKLSIQDVNCIRFDLLCGLTGKSIAKEYHVSKTTVSRIKLRRTFDWIP